MEDKRKVQLFSPYFTLSFSFSEKILAWNIIQKELKASKGEDIVKEQRGSEWSQISCRSGNTKRICEWNTINGIQIITSEAKKGRSPRKQGERNRDPISVTTLKQLKTTQNI